MKDKKSASITLRIPKKEKEALIKAAKDQNRSVSQLIQMIVNDAMESGKL